MGKQCIPYRQYKALYLALYNVYHYNGIYIYIAYIVLIITCCTLYTPCHHVSTNLALYWLWKKVIIAVWMFNIYILTYDRLKWYIDIWLNKLPGLGRSLYPEIRIVSLEVLHINSWIFCIQTTVVGRIFPLIFNIIPVHLIFEMYHRKSQTCSHQQNFCIVTNYGLKAVLLPIIHNYAENGIAKCLQKMSI